MPSETADVSVSTLQAPPQLKCPDCDFIATESKYLGRHRQAKHGYVGVSRSSVIARERRVSSKQPVSKWGGRHKCDQCGAGFQNVGNLVLHQANKHGAKVNNGTTTRGKRKCPDCDRSFANLMGLSIHRARAHNVPGAAHPLKQKQHPQSSEAVNGDSNGHGQDIEEQLITENASSWALGKCEAVIQECATRTGVPFTVIAANISRVFSHATRGTVLGTSHRVPLLRG